MIIMCSCLCNAYFPTRAADVRLKNPVGDEEQLEVQDEDLGGNYCDLNPETDDDAAANGRAGIGDEVKRRLCRIMRSHAQFKTPQVTPATCAVHDVHPCMR
jgi:hypothetical protein